MDTRDYRDLTKAIAPILGENWKAVILGEGGQEDPHNGYYCTLVRKDGLTISCGKPHEYSQRARIMFRGVAGDMLVKHINSYSDEQVPAITVSPGKPPEQMVKDIQRRLLPEWERFYQVLLEREQQHKRYENTLADNKSYLESALGRWADVNPQRTDNQRSTVHIRYSYVGGYGDVQVYEDTANLDLRSVPIPLAWKLLAAIREYKDQALAEAQGA